jgi:hypothetical protein
MARKNKGLPFVVQPRLKPIIEQIGTDLSGIIEIERKGYLTVAEKAMVQQSMGDNSALTDAYMTARSIAAKAGVSATQVFDDIASEEPPAYVNEHRDEVSKMMSSMLAHEEKLRLVASTALIITRVNPDWDPSDTIGLHPDLQAALFKLYSDEEKKSIEALEAAAKEVDKSQEGSEGKE